ncbi:MAG: DNA polymerase IV, partial [Pseudomonadota bacterium]
MPALCRDCFHQAPAAAQTSSRCSVCGSPRLLSHPELETLSIAHIDCDA